MARLLGEHVADLFHRQRRDVRKGVLTLACSCQVLNGCCLLMRKAEGNAALTDNGGSGRALPLNNPQAVAQARNLREVYPGTAGAFQWIGRASSVYDMRRAHQSSPQRPCVAVSANP
jgi:hypothetical protein